MRDYLALPVHTLAERRVALVGNVAHVELGDPASAVMTDLRVAPSVVVPSTEALDDSRRLMQHAGVRMAFVIETGGDVVGLATAADLQGERPMLIAAGRQLAQRELSVADVMTPVAAWSTIDVARLANARVGDIVETFRRAGDRYLIAIELLPEPDAENTPRTVVRGVFSASRVERALGHSIDIELRPRSFADLASALAHH